MALNEADALRWVKLLHEVTQLSISMAMHVALCDACRENNAGVRGICTRGDNIWDSLDKAERVVIAEIPAMRAAGLDVTDADLKQLRRKADLDGNN